MNKFPSLLLLLILVLLQLAPVTSAQQQRGQEKKPSAAQTSASQQTGEDPYDDEVVRITTNLVQVDAVVTDKNGRYVTDLKPEDFEIVEDGKKQSITNFSYIEVAPNATPSQPAASATKTPSVKNVPTIAPARLKPEDVRRTVALVVDDLCLSQESIGGVRKALKKYVDEQMQPGDLVAILRTAAGLGKLQQFTDDKRLLYTAIDRIRFYPNGRCGSIAIEPTTGFDEMEKGLEGDNPTKVDAPGALPKQVNQARADLIAVGTLGALRYVVQGLRELPGRKAVVLFSDGIRLIDPAAIFEGKDKTDSSDYVREQMRQLVDTSNRSSVVIYTMDTRGLQPVGFTAADQGMGSGPQSLATLSDRQKFLYETQDGLNYLAKGTGGIFIHNTNDLGDGMRRVVEDQKGFYLLGYRPDESTFDPKTGQRRFHSLNIKIKRPGLQIRSRTGFYGVAESAAPTRPATPVQQMAAAISSPFAASGVDLRMASLFTNDPAQGSFMRSLVFVNARDLKFAEEADGWRKATINLMAVTFNAEGHPVEQVTETREVRVTQKGYETLMQNGLTYALNVPVKQPGAYQLRVAVRDTSSSRIGSASQVIEVPDLTKDQISLSGIRLEGVNPKAAPDAQDPQAGPAVRRLKQGMVLDYGYVIYNAQLDKATMKPQVTTQMRIFKDGQPVFTGKLSSLDVSQQKDWKRLLGGGQFQIGRELTPGDYILQVTVTDMASKGKPRIATQWMDFEIVQ